MDPNFQKIVVQLLQIYYSLSRACNDSPEMKYLIPIHAFEEDFIVEWPSLFEKADGSTIYLWCMYFRQHSFEPYSALKRFFDSLPHETPPTEIWDLWKKKIMKAFGCTRNENLSEEEDFYAQTGMSFDMLEDCILQNKKHEADGMIIYPFEIPKGIPGYLLEADAKRIIRERAEQGKNTNPPQQGTMPR